MTRVFKSRAEAQAAGHSVRTDQYPWRVMQTPGADPHIPAAPIVRTDLEAQLAEALAPLEWSGGFNGMAACPTCQCLRPIHAEGCALKAALRAYRDGS